MIVNGTFSQRILCFCPSYCYFERKGPNCLLRTELYISSSHKCLPHKLELNLLTSQLLAAVLEKCLNTPLHFSHSNSKARIIENNKKNTFNFLVDFRFNKIPPHGKRA